MKLLLDTHFLIWLAIAPSKISPAEYVVLSDPANGLNCSAVTLWEIRIKWQTTDQHGKRKVALSPSAALDFAAAQKIELAALAPAHAVSALTPPLAHRDPFDEMLLVHAQQLGARLLTRDRQLADHPLALAI